MLITCVILVFAYQSIFARKSRVSKLRGSLEELEPKKVGQTLVQRHLISNSTEVNAKDIVQNHNQIFNLKSLVNYPGSVIGFVTPWNKDGYRIAKRFRNKLDLIVPVWYDIKFGNDGLTLKKSDGIDKEWLEKLRKPDKVGLSQKKPKIAPRFYLENFSRQDFERLITNERLTQSFIRIVKTECEKYRYDGIFLDFGSLSFASIPGVPQNHPDSKKFQQQISLLLFGLMKFFEAVGTELAKDRLSLHISMASPGNFQSSFPLVHTLAVQRALTAGWVKGILVMTYDYMGHQSGGPIAPLQWAVGSCENFQQPPPQLPPEFGDVTGVRAEQIHLGLNFYGTDNVGGRFLADVVAKDYIKILKEYRTSFSWNTQAMEHQLEYYDSTEARTHTVFYPTLLSLSYRLQVARERGYGVGIWELGQGLEYFMDLL